MGEKKVYDVRNALEINEAAQSRIHDLERQVAEGEARWRELRAYCNADLAIVSRDSDRGMTFLDVLARMNHLDREPTADCVRVVMEESTSYTAIVGSADGDIPEVESDDVLYLVRLKGVE